MRIIHDCIYISVYHTVTVYSMILFNAVLVSFSLFFCLFFPVLFFCFPAHFVPTTVNVSPTTIFGTVGPG